MKVAVIGTGTLGPSIAQVFSQCEKVDKVFLCKGRDSSVGSGKDKIEKSFARLAEKGKISGEQEAFFLSKIETGNKGLAAGSDLVVEAVTEDVEIKKAVFRELDRICGPETVFATNTSSIPIQTIGEGLSRPLIGMHFFNPAPVMKLVEVIATDRTTQDMVDFIMGVARDLGKTPVEVREAPGVVVNRVLIPMINEAISIYAEGVASVEDIDTAMTLGANQPMGATTGIPL